MALFGTCPVCDGPLSARPAMQDVVRIGPGMRWCGNCGAEYAAGDAKCPVCDEGRPVACTDVLRDHERVLLA